MRNTYILLFAGTFLSTLLVAPAVSQSQPGNQGFVSIDCGGVAGKDPITGLDWVTDEDFLDSAKQLIEEGVAVSAIAHLDQDDEAKAKSRDNSQQSSTAMAFIPGRMSRSKYCYNLPASYNEFSNSTNYLVRATFPSSNLTADVLLNVYGTRFYFTVDSTFITTIDLDPVEPQTVELVVTSLDDTIFVCLVPLEDRSSMPAISSLELRPVESWMLPKLGSEESNTASNTTLQTTYFITVSRLNVGGDLQSPAIRFPNDTFDRLWEPARIPEELVPEIKVVRGGADNVTVKSSKPEDMPAEVLATAWEGANLASVISFTFNISKAQADRPVPTFYLNMVLTDVHPGTNFADQRVVDIFLLHSGAAYNSSKESWISDTVITNSSILLVYNKKQVFLSDLATFSIEPTSNSTLPAMVNAVEVYGEFEAVIERTARFDATSIRKFASNFANQVDTAGDPCLPVSWDWLVCSIEIPPRITQINLTSQGVTGELDTEFGFLNRLTVLDLSNNRFHGSLPSSLVEVVTVRSLNIAHNNLSGELPPFQAKSLENLETLSLRDNNLNGSLLSLVKALADPASSLDLSSNQFSGSIPVEISELRNLRTLDLSNNQISGGLRSELVKLPALGNLRLKNNKLDGMVPDDVWSSESKLVNLDLEGNEFTELNLTTWSQIVLETQSFDAYEQKVTLVSNQIRNVIIPAPQEDFELVDQSSPIPSPKGFILLGGNPWCQGVEEDANATLVQRYLCRFDESFDFWSPQPVDKSGVSERLLAAIGVTSGLLVLFMACIFALFLYRMWKRMNELREIQEALAKDDVRPPFFKYEDLRIATRDFAPMNELGKGAFGAVYKAVLGDGSIVAVKRLFPTEQNVTDFLKEMVLITGIKHRHLVQLKGCCVRDKQRMLIYEYAENKNLAEALWGYNRPCDLTWAQRLNICVGIARGLAYLHEELHPKIIHRDIKPQNILLDKDWNPKIADFGLARPVAIDNDATQMSSHVGGTLGYFSPEYATMGRFTEKLDVYSYGVLVLEIVSGRRCIDFSLPEEEVYLRNWAFHLYKEGKLVNMAARSLLAVTPADEVLSVLRTALACLQEDPNRRPSMSQVVNMLVGNSDLAVDIMKELKDQQLLFDDLFDETVAKAMNGHQEKEVRVLLSSNFSSNPLIELSGMKPR